LSLPEWSILWGVPLQNFPTSFAALEVNRSKKKKLG